MNRGIINSVTRLHLVGYFYWNLSDRILCILAKALVFLHDRWHFPAGFCPKLRNSAWFGFSLSYGACLKDWRSGTVSDDTFGSFPKERAPFWLGCPYSRQNFSIYISLLKLIPAVSLARNCDGRIDYERRLVYSSLAGGQTFIGIL